MRLSLKIARPAISAKNATIRMRNKASMVNGLRFAMIRTKRGYSSIIAPEGVGRVLKFGWGA